MCSNYMWNNVQLHGGTIILPHQTREFMRRKKRGLFNIAQDSPVPKKHHIWTIADKLLAFFVPGIGVASLMEEVQVTRYELISFINTTKIMMEGIKEELRGLRLTALQINTHMNQLIKYSPPSGVHTLRCLTVNSTIKV